MKLRATANADCERDLIHVNPYIQRESNKINLALNESPFQVPDGVKAAIAAALDHLHEYPVGLETKVPEEVIA